MGVHAVASNAEPRKIGDAWRRFHEIGGIQSIAARISDDVYCVYCEYEGDWTQPFTVVIGCAVDASAVARDGMKMVAIEAGSYAVFAAQGELPQSIFYAWSEVWQTSLNRRYQADYDRYDESGATVHVGVR
jgi:predicted transcriptional regulator YdeE